MGCMQGALPCKLVDLLRVRCDVLAQAASRPTVGYVLVCFQQQEQPIHCQQQLRLRSHPLWLFMHGRSQYTSSQVLYCAVNFRCWRAAYYTNLIPPPV